MDHLKERRDELLKESKEIMRKAYENIGVSCNAQGPTRDMPDDVKAVSFMGSFFESGILQVP